MNIDTKMQAGHIIRETESICPVCLERVAAFVIEKDSGVFFLKDCSQHGEFKILLSRDPLHYKKLDEFYFGISYGYKRVREYEIWPTLKCNTDCTICCFGKERRYLEGAEPSCSEIEEFVKSDRNGFYILSGGEPTCRDDLAEIVKTFKRHRKAVTINTNGLKLSDIEYLNKLKMAGLNRVNLQFDGFNRDVYRILRGKDLLDIKLKIVNNLKTLGIQTTFNTTIAKNVNDKNTAELIDFAAKNEFISGINFFTICYLGGARKWPLDNYIMPDELIDIIEEKTKAKITKRNVFLFQKLHLAIKSFLSQKYCFYNQIYLLVRHKGTYEAIDKFLDLSKAEFWLDKYKMVFKKSKTLSAVYLAVAIVAMSVNVRAFIIFKELFLSGVSYFLKTSCYLKNRLFIYLSFSTGCDPYKVDYSILRNCQNEIIAMGDNSGKLEYYGCDGLYCIDLEKKFVGTKTGKLPYS